MSLPENEWFTEVFQNEGTAFSLQIKKHLQQEKSPYQTIDMYETETFGNLMSIDGCVMLTSRDNFLYHEMMSHPALFTHQNPERVVIIGGGDCGTLKEVLKHSTVKHVTQVDIDELVTRMSEKYFPELCTSNEDPRAELLFDDGIAWMRNAESDSVDEGQSEEKMHRSKLGGVVSNHSNDKKFRRRPCQRAARCYRCEWSRTKFVRPFNLRSHWNRHI